MPIVDESKQNKGVNNNTQNKQMAINMEYQNRLNHPSLNLHILVPNISKELLQLEL